MEKNMKVELVSYTAPKSADWSWFESSEKVLHQIAHVARVSNPSNQNNIDTSAKLVNYLIKNKHWSPLEMVDATLEIETTRDIARQILRHRSFSFQEFSQRYADPTRELAFDYREARLQDKKNRQNSIDTDDVELQQEWITRQDEIVDLVRETYDWAIENGIAKEQARVVLPEGLTVSRLYMKGSLRSWIHYIELRTANGTQKEHMEVAEECAKEIATIFPLIESHIGEK